MTLTLSKRTRGSGMSPMTPSVNTSITLEGTFAGNHALLPARGPAPGMSSIVLSPGFAPGGGSESIERDGLGRPLTPGSSGSKISEHHLLKTAGEICASLRRRVELRSGAGRLLWPVRGAAASRRGLFSGPSSAESRVFFSQLKEPPSGGRWHTVSHHF